MNKRINIGDKEKALSDIHEFSLKHYKPTDIEFFNVHLKELNDTCNKKIFDKNNLYVRSSTLWELMQPEGNKGKHNFHGLTGNDIFNVLKSLLQPFAVYYSRDSRIVISTNEENNRHEKIQIVIELHASLENNRDANINKIVSIYPKKNILNKLNSMDNSLIVYRSDK